jgi:MmpS family membrane protein
MSQEEVVEELSAAEDGGEREEGRARVATTARLKAVWRDHRPKVLAGAGALVAAAVAGTVLAVAFSGEEPDPPPYTVAVTYKVTGEGTATIVYNDGDPDDGGRRQQAVDLPWSKNVRVNPDSGTASVSIILGKDGGRAACAIAVRGKHRQTSSAFGSYGRATCSAKVPAKNS